MSFILYGLLVFYVVMILVLGIVVYKFYFSVPYKYLYYYNVLSNDGYKKYRIENDSCSFRKGSLQVTLYTRDGIYFSVDDLSDHYWEEKSYNGSMVRYVRGFPIKSYSIREFDIIFKQEVRDYKLKTLI